MVGKYQFDDVNNMFDSFNHTFEKIIEKTHQIVKLSEKKFMNYIPWLLQELNCFIAKRNFLKNFFFSKGKKFLALRRTKNLSAWET